MSLDPLEAAWAPGNASPATRYNEENTLERSISSPTQTQHTSASLSSSPKEVRPHEEAGQPATACGAAHTADVSKNEVVQTELRVMPPLEGVLASSASISTNSTATRRATKATRPPSLTSSLLLQGTAGGVTAASSSPREAKRTLPEHYAPPTRTAPSASIHSTHASFSACSPTANPNSSAATTTMSSPVAAMRSCDAPHKLSSFGLPSSAAGPITTTTTTAAQSSPSKASPRVSDGNTCADFSTFTLSSPLSELVRGAALREDADAPFLNIPDELLRRAVPSAAAEHAVKSDSHAKAQRSAAATAQCTTRGEMTWRGSPPPFYGSSGATAGGAAGVGAGGFEYKISSSTSTSHSRSAKATPSPQPEANARPCGGVAAAAVVAAAAAAASAAAAAKRPRTSPSSLVDLSSMLEANRAVAATLMIDPDAPRPKSQQQQQQMLVKRTPPAAAAPSAGASPTGHAPVEAGSATGNGKREEVATSPLAGRAAADATSTTTPTTARVIRTHGHRVARLELPQSPLAPPATSSSSSHSDSALSLMNPSGDPSTDATPTSAFNSSIAMPPVRSRVTAVPLVMSPISFHPNASMTRSFTFALANSSTAEYGHANSTTAITNAFTATTRASRSTTNTEGVATSPTLLRGPGRTRGSAAVDAGASSSASVLPALRSPSHLTVTQVQSSGSTDASHSNHSRLSSSNTPSFILPHSPLSPAQAWPHGRDFAFHTGGGSPTLVTVDDGGSSGSSGGAVNAAATSAAAAATYISAGAGSSASPTATTTQLTSSLVHGGDPLERRASMTSRSPKQQQQQPQQPPLVQHYLQHRHPSSSHSTHLERVHPVPSITSVLSSGDRTDAPFHFEDLLDGNTASSFEEETLRDFAAGTTTDFNDDDDDETFDDTDALIAGPALRSRGSYSHRSLSSSSRGSRLAARRAGYAQRRPASRGQQPLSSSLDQQPRPQAQPQQSALLLSQQQEQQLSAQSSTPLQVLEHEEEQQQLYYPTQLDNARQQPHSSQLSGQQRQQQRQLAQQQQQRVRLASSITRESPRGVEDVDSASTNNDDETVHHGLLRSIEMPSFPFEGGETATTSSSGISAAAAAASLVAAWRVRPVPSPRSSVASQVFTVDSASTSSSSHPCQLLPATGATTPSGSLIGGGNSTGLPPLFGHGAARVLSSAVQATTPKDREGRASSVAGHSVAMNTSNSHNGSNHNTNNATTGVAGVPLPRAPSSNGGLRGTSPPTGIRDDGLRPRSLAEQRLLHLFYSSRVPSHATAGLDNSPSNRTTGSHTSASDVGHPQGTSYGRVNASSGSGRGNRGVYSSSANRTSHNDDEHDHNSITGGVRDVLDTSLTAPEMPEVLPSATPQSTTEPTSSVITAVTTPDAVPEHNHPEGEESSSRTAMRDADGGSKDAVLSSFASPHTVQQFHLQQQQHQYSSPQKVQEEGEKEKEGQQVRTITSASSSPRPDSASRGEEDGVPAERDLNKKNPITAFGAIAIGGGGSSSHVDASTMVGEGRNESVDHEVKTESVDKLSDEVTCRTEDAAAVTATTPAAAATAARRPPHTGPWGASRVARPPPLKLLRRSVHSTATASGFKTSSSTEAAEAAEAAEGRHRLTGPDDTTSSATAAAAASSGDAREKNIREGEHQAISSATRLGGSEEAAVSSAPAAAFTSAQVDGAAEGRHKIPPPGETLGDTCVAPQRAVPSVTAVGSRSPASYATPDAYPLPLAGRAATATSPTSTARPDDWPLGTLGVRHSTSLLYDSSLVSPATLKSQPEHESPCSRIRSTESMEGEKGVCPSAALVDNFTKTDSHYANPHQSSSGSHTTSSHPGICGTSGGSQAIINAQSDAQLPRSSVVGEELSLLSLFSQPSAPPAQLDRQDTVVSPASITTTAPPDSALPSVTTAPASRLNSTTAAPLADDAARESRSNTSVHKSSSVPHTTVVKGEKEGMGVEGEGGSALLPSRWATSAKVKGLLRLSRVESDTVEAAADLNRDETELREEEKEQGDGDGGDGAPRAGEAADQQEHCKAVPCAAAARHVSTSAADTVPPEDAETKPRASGEQEEPQQQEMRPPASPLRPLTWHVRLLWILLPYGVFVVLLALATLVATHVVAQGIVAHSWNEIHTYMRSELVAFMEEVTLLPVMSGEIMTSRRTKDSAHPRPTDPPRPPIINVSRALCAALKFTDLGRSMVTLSYASISALSARDDIVYVPSKVKDATNYSMGRPVILRMSPDHVTAHGGIPAYLERLPLPLTTLSNTANCTLNFTDDSLLSDVEATPLISNKASKVPPNLTESAANGGEVEEDDDPELQTAFAFCDAGYSSNYYVTGAREAVRVSERHRLRHPTTLYAINATTIDVGRPLRKVTQAPPCFDGNLHARISHVLPIVHAWKSAVARRDNSETRVARWWISSEPFERPSIMYVHPFYEYGRTEPSYVSCRMDAEVLLRGYVEHQQTQQRQLEAQQQQQQKQQQHKLPKSQPSTLVSTQARVMLVVPRWERPRRYVTSLRAQAMGRKGEKDVLEAAASARVEPRILARSWALDLGLEARRKATMLSPRTPKETPTHRASPAKVRTTTTTAAPTSATLRASNDTCQKVCHIAQPANVAAVANQDDATLLLTHYVDCCTANNSITTAVAAAAGAAPPSKPHNVASTKDKQEAATKEGQHRRRSRSRRGKEHEVNEEEDDRPTEDDGDYFEDPHWWPWSFYDSPSPTIRLDNVGDPLMQAALRVVDVQAYAAEMKARLDEWFVAGSENDAVFDAPAAPPSSSQHASQQQPQQREQHRRSLRETMAQCLGRSPSFTDRASAAAAMQECVGEGLREAQPSAMKTANGVRYDTDVNPTAKLGDGRRTFMPTLFREFYFEGQRAAVSVSAVQLRSNFSAVVVLATPLAVTKGNGTETAQRYFAATVVALVAVGSTFVVYLILAQYLQLPLISIRQQLERVVVLRTGKVTPLAPPFAENLLNKLDPEEKETKARLADDEQETASAAAVVTAKKAVVNTLIEPVSSDAPASEARKGDVSEDVADTQDRVLPHTQPPQDCVSAFSTNAKERKVRQMEREKASSAVQSMETSADSSSSAALEAAAAAALAREAEGEHDDDAPRAGLLMSFALQVRFRLLRRAAPLVNFLMRLRMAEVAELQDVCRELRQHVREMQQYIPENYNFDASGSGFVPPSSTVTRDSSFAVTAANSQCTAHPLPNTARDRAAAAVTSLPESLASSMRGERVASNSSHAGPTLRVLATPTSAKLSARRTPLPHVVKVDVTEHGGAAHSVDVRSSINSSGGADALVRPAEQHRAVAAGGERRGKSAREVGLSAAAARSGDASGSGLWGLSPSCSVLHTQGSMGSAVMKAGTTLPSVGHFPMGSRSGDVALSATASAAQPSSHNGDVAVLAEKEATAALKDSSMKSFVVADDGSGKPNVKNARTSASGDGAASLNTPAATPAATTAATSSAPPSPALPCTTAPPRTSQSDRLVSLPQDDKECSTARPAAVQLPTVLDTSALRGSLRRRRTTAASSQVGRDENALLYGEAEEDSDDDDAFTFSVSGRGSSKSHHHHSVYSDNNRVEDGEAEADGHPPTSQLEALNSTRSRPTARSHRHGTDLSQPPQHRHHQHPGAQCSFSKCLCTILCIHVHLDDAADVMGQFPEILETTVDCVHRYGGVFDVFLPEMIYATFGSRVRTKDHAVMATRCGIEIFSRLSSRALRYMTFVVDTGVYSVGMCGVPEHKGIVVWGRPSSELFFEQQFQSGFRFLVTDSTVPLIRQHFRVLPVDVVTIEEELGKPNLVLYLVLVGSVEDPQWEPFSQLAHEAFLNLIRGHFEAACPLYEQLIHSPFATFTIIFQYLLTHERVLTDNKAGLSSTELARQLDELTVTCVNELARTRNPVEMPFGAAMPWIAGRPELLGRFSDDESELDAMDPPYKATEHQDSTMSGSNSENDVALSAMTSPLRASEPAQHLPVKQKRAKRSKKTAPPPQPLRELSADVDAPFHLESLRNPLKAMSPAGPPRESAKTYDQGEEGSHRAAGDARRTSAGGDFATAAAAAAAAASVSAVSASTHETSTPASLSERTTHGTGKSASTVSTTTTLIGSSGPVEAGMRATGPAATTTATTATTLSTPATVSRTTVASPSSATDSQPSQPQLHVHPPPSQASSPAPSAPCTEQDGASAVPCSSEPPDSLDQMSTPCDEQPRREVASTDDGGDGTDSTNRNVKDEKSGVGDDAVGADDDSDDDSASVQQRIAVPQTHFRGIALRVMDLSERTWQLSNTPIEGPAAPLRLDTSLSFLGISAQGAMAEIAVYPVNLAQQAVSMWSSCSMLSLQSVGTATGLGTTTTPLSATTSEAAAATAANAAAAYTKKAGSAPPTLPRFEACTNEEAAVLSDSTATPKHASQSVKDALCHFASAFSSRVFSHHEPTTPAAVDTPISGVSTEASPAHLSESLELSIYANFLRRGRGEEEEGLHSDLMDDVDSEGVGVGVPAGTTTSPYLPHTTARGDAAGDTATAAAPARLAAGALSSNGAENTHTNKTALSTTMTGGSRADEAATQRSSPVNVDLEAMHVVARRYSQGNMLQLLSMAVTPTHVYTIYEWMAGRTLRETVSRFGSRLAMTTARKCCVSVLRALDHLHNTRGVVHGRVHPDNILFGVEGNCKITGMLYLYKWALPDPALHAKLTRIPAAYCSPEVNAGAAPTPASDIYAFGLVLLQMLTGEVPWTWAGVTIESYDANTLELLSMMQDDKVFLEALRAGVLELRQYGPQRNQYNLSVEAQRQHNKLELELQQQQRRQQRQQQRDMMGRPRRAPPPARKKTATFTDTLHAPPVYDWEEEEDGEEKEEPAADPAMLRVLESCLAFDPSQRKGASELLQIFSDM